MRECFAYGGGTNGLPIIYRADWPDCRRPCNSGVSYGGGFPDEKWTPSIHMPRQASRLTLLVKRVWVERVQDISEADAYAEGVTDEWPLSMPYLSGFGGRAVLNNFATLWDSIYAAKGNGWDENPWVRGCEFERGSR